MLWKAKEADIEAKADALKSAPPSETPSNPAPPPADEGLREELDTLRRQHDQLQVDLSLRKARIADLLTEIALAQTDAEQARAEVRELKSSLEPQRMNLQLAREDASLKDVLASVTKLEGVHMALLADDYGLVVETAGRDLPPDKLAAVSSLLAQVGANVEDIFTMGPLKTVVLGDENGFVLENIYFDLFTLRCALTIARDADRVYPGLAEQTIEAIVSRLQ